MASIQNGESVLEVAVGAGLTFREILRANPSDSNFGIHLTPAVVEKASAKAAKLELENYQLKVGDAYALKFPDDQFDPLINNYMFDLLPEEDFTTVLHEFKRKAQRPACFGEYDPGGTALPTHLGTGLPHQPQVARRFWSHCKKLALKANIEKQSANLVSRRRLL